MRLKYNLRYLFLAHAMLAAGLAVWYYADRFWAADRRHTRELTMRSILMGIYAYSDQYGTLPPAVLRSADGKPFHSWRFLVCRPWLGDSVQTAFYGQDALSAYDAAWDSPANRRYFVGPHRNYAGSPNSFIADSKQQTRFVAVTGPGTAFEEDRPISLRDVDPDTILVIEVARPNWHWMKPGGDLDVSILADQGCAGDLLGDFENGEFLVLFADGAVWTLSQDVPIGRLKKFFLIDAAKSHDRGELLEPYRTNSPR